MKCPPSPSITSLPLRTIPFESPLVLLTPIIQFLIIDLSIHTYSDYVKHHHSIFTLNAMSSPNQILACCLLHSYIAVIILHICKHSSSLGLRILVAVTLPLPLLHCYTPGFAKADPCDAISHLLVTSLCTYNGIQQV